LEIYLKLLNEIENESLVSALEGIIQHFDQDIIPFAIGICQILVDAFYKYHKAEYAENEE